MTPTFTTAQRAVVDSAAPTITVIAGPGSGKTRVLTERIKRLRNDGADPGRMVAITFTNSAAREIRERLDAIRLGYVGTLHGFMLRLLHTRGAALGYDARSTVIDTQAEEGLLNVSIAETGIKATKKAIKEAIALGHSGIMAKGVRLTPPETVASRFFRNLRAGNLMTFDTVLQAGHDLIVSLSDVRFEHLFVDEYQDSTSIDAAIYRALPIANKLFVGDPDQAIYSFRGGDVQNILDASADGAEQHWLETNFRSTSEICRAAQEVIERNFGRINKRTEPSTEDIGLVEHTEFGSEAEELAAIVAGVTSAGPTRCAVLLRTNALVDRYASHCAALGIPIVRRVATDYPNDWRQTIEMIRLLNDPTNDQLACWWMTMKSGATAANKGALQAKVAKRSLNDLFLHIPVGIGLDGLGAALTQLGASLASIQFASTIAESTEAESLSDLLVAIAEHGTEHDQGSGLTVTTYHGAKGREWPIVFLPALEQETFPGSRKSLDIEEERRIYFVGITRAKHTLRLSWAATRTPSFGGFQPKPTTRSQFYSEVTKSVEMPRPVV